MDPIQIPEPLNSDLQALLGELQQLGTDQADLQTKTQAADQAITTRDAAGQVVQADESAVAAARGKVQQDLDALTSVFAGRRGAQRGGNQAAKSEQMRAAETAGRQQQRQQPTSQQAR